MRFSCYHCILAIDVLPSLLLSLHCTHWITIALPLNTFFLPVILYVHTPRVAGLHSCYSRTMDHSLSQSTDNRLLLERISLHYSPQVGQYSVGETLWMRLHNLYRDQLIIGQGEYGVAHQMSSTLHFDHRSALVFRMDVHNVVFDLGRPEVNRFNHQRKRYSWATHKYGSVCAP